MTIVTSYILCVISAVCSINMFSLWTSYSQRSTFFWGIAFILISASSFFGGTFHGFLLSLGPVTGDIIWKLSLTSMVFSSFCMLVGSIIATHEQEHRTILIAIAGIKIIFVMVMVIQNPVYRIIIFDSGITILWVMLLHSADHHEHGIKRWFLTAGTVSLLASLVYLTRISVGWSFNHNDLYNIIQIFAVLLFHHGTALIQDK